MSKIRGKTSFKDDWLDRTINSDWNWLQRVESDNYKGYCSLCRTSFDISNMGVSSVRSHAKGKKHIDRVNASSSSKKLFHMVPAKEATTVNAAPSTTNSVPVKAELCEVLTSVVNDKHTCVVPRSTLNNFIIKDEVITAEILWAVTQIMTHSSARSFGFCSDLFKVMFPDSEIAKKFRLHKDKLGYLVTYGLGPYFQKELTNLVKECPCFCISFDESLNSVAQKGQMDMSVRFWDGNLVQTRYLTSAFLGHATAEDLLMTFLQNLKDTGLDAKKMLQVSMDGPNVNLKFSKNLKKYLADSPSDPELLDFGTCSLHTIHGAYKTAHNNSEWNIHRFLRSLYYFFKNHPSRRADYTHITGSHLFPLKFCSIRWVENSNVIERAVEMLPHIKKYVDAFEKKPPASENFGIIKSFVRNDLLPAQLGFMRSVSLELEQYLSKYQSNDPLLPFMFYDLCTMLEHLLGRIVKKQVLESANTSKKLLSIDLKKTENLKPFHAVDIGFAASAALKGKGIKDVKVLQFYGDCRKFIVDICMKIFVKSPLAFKFVKGASCFNPAIMTNSSIRTYRVTAALEVLVETKQLSSIEADIAKRDYLDFSSKEEVVKYLNKFDPKTDRLDHFLSTAYFQHNVSKELIHFTQKVLVLFHGNAAVERGFSINKECLVENLHENSLVAQRVVYDAVSAAGGVLAISVSKKMIHAAKNASTLRNEALEKYKKSTDNIAAKRKLAAEEIKHIELKKRCIMQSAKEETEELEKEVKRLKKILS